MNAKTIVLNAAKMNFDGNLDFSVLSDEVVVYDDTTPEELLELAVAAFGDRDDRADLAKALATFCRRFISQQFKRNCAPEAPRILEISLNARSGWQMPSLMDGTLWR